MNKKAFALVLCAMTMTIVFLSGCSSNNGNPNPTHNRYAVITVSGGISGTIKILLYEDKMPVTTANFIRLAQSGFYDGLIFHRIGPTFMIQGGGYDINGTLKQDPYGTINLETSADVTHVDGAISMARTSDKNSATSQFFICVGAQHFLDGNYAAFGVVTEGLDVVHNIAAQPQDNSGGDGTGKPITPIIMSSVTIVDQ